MNVKRRKEILRTRLAAKKEEVAAVELKVETEKVEVPAPVVVEEPKKKVSFAKKVVEEKPAEEKVVAPAAE